MNLTVWIVGTSPLVFLATILGACSDQPMRIDVDEPREIVVLNSLKETHPLHAIVRDRNGDELRGTKVFWSSSNRNVVEASPEGRLTPKRDGQALITARSGYAQRVIAVTVAIYASIEPDETKLVIGEGDKARLIARIRGMDGSVLHGTLTWSSRDPSVAAVGPDGRVTAVREGATTIDVSAKDVSATIEITVYPDAAES